MELCRDICIVAKSVLFFFLEFFTSFRPHNFSSSPNKSTATSSFKPHLPLLHKKKKLDLPQSRTTQRFQFSFCPQNAPAHPHYCHHRRHRGCDVTTRRRAYCCWTWFYHDQNPGWVDSRWYYGFLWWCHHRRIRLRYPSIGWCCRFRTRCSWMNCWRSHRGVGAALIN